MAETKNGPASLAGNSVLVEIQNATIAFRQKVFFSDLNLEIRENQHWAVTGKSGSGKTTLLRAIAGQYLVLKGRIRHFPPERKRAVYLDIRHDFQPLAGSGNFFYQQRFNAGYADNSPAVEHYLKQKAADAPDSNAWPLNRLYELFNLDSIRHRNLIKLSSGETKRLRIAAALLENPLLLLLDCPFAGIDAATRQKFENIFSNIAQSGTSLVMVTNTDRIPRVITHVAALDSHRSLHTHTRHSFFRQTEKNTPHPQARADTGLIKNLINEGPRDRFEVLVSMRNIHVAYSKSVVLENISWQMRQKEHWALTGPNGSGKSTLLSLINGDHPQAYANDIVLFDRKRGSGESIWDIKKRIGFMSPELFQFFPGRYSCLQVVESGFYDTLGMVLKNLPEHRQKAEKWMSIMDLSGIRNLAFSEAPAGLQRMCLLARALVKNPYLLLLDEPCQGLERTQQLAFRQLIDTIAELSDLTLVYVTHQSEELPGCIQKTLSLT